MLTDPACRNISCPPTKRHVRLTDSGGLFLEVTPNGSKRWFWRYTFGGKVRALSLGSYSKPGSKAVLMSLRDARAARDDARRAQQAGADPVEDRKTAKRIKAASSATTFEAVAREFHAMKSSTWSESHAAQWLRCLEKDVFPWLGHRPLDGIEAPELLAALRKVQARGAKRMGHDLREFAGQVFRYGIASGSCKRNPAADLRGALVPYVERNMAAIVDPMKVAELLRALDAYAGQPATRAALALSPLLFQRPGNVRRMEWSEVDADAAVWTIPATKMKRTVAGKVNGKPHLVPLAPQALAILAELRPLTGHGRYVFPSLLGGERCMSENTVRNALRRLGYGNDEMTPHGFRATARTLIAEKLPGIAADVIEAQLAHGKSGPLGTAYDRAEYMEQRRQMMTAWADYLDKLRNGADVVPLRAA